MIPPERGGVRWTLAALCITVCAALPGANTRTLSVERARDAGRARNSIGLSGLSVERSGSWTQWWQTNSAPVHWGGPLATVAQSISWRPTTNPGVEWGELRLSGSGEAWRVRVIVARIDPRHVRIRLDSAFDGSLGRAAWTIDNAPRGAILAVNAGQFVGSLPWGWVVLNGHEFLKPGIGPLSTVVVIDSTGAVRLIPPDRISSERSAGHVVDAFQSYPTLLRGDGDIPEPLQQRLQPRFATEAVNLEHRDARLAIGQLRDGRILIALTRFDALDGTFDYVPFGLTTPEMAAVMGALGCRDAVMLDGGISSQMMIRVSPTNRRRWRGIRRVPLGLVVIP